MKYYYKRIATSLFLTASLVGQVKLAVNTIPTRVDVHLDGINLGSSPIKNERITPGVHKFEIKKKGYAPLTYDLLVNPAQVVQQVFILLLEILYVVWCIKKLLKVVKKVENMV